MPRKKKDPAALAALEATPLEPKPKRRRKAIETILDSRRAKESVEPDAPLPEPSHAAHLGPRKREPDEPFNFYGSANVRVSKDPETYKGRTVGFTIEIKRPLTNETRDGETMYLSSSWHNKLTGYGFDDVSEKGDGSLWLADVRQLMEGRPETAKILMQRINIIGPMLDGKYQNISGESQGR